MIESINKGHPKTTLGCPFNFKPLTEPVSTRPAASLSSFRLPFSVLASVSVADAEEAARASPPVEGYVAVRARPVVAPAAAGPADWASARGGRVPDECLRVAASDDSVVPLAVDYSARAIPRADSARDDLSPLRVDDSVPQERPDADYSGVRWEPEQTDGSRADWRPAPWAAPGGRQSADSSDVPSLASPVCPGAPA